MLSFINFLNEGRIRGDFIVQGEHDGKTVYVKLTPTFTTLVDDIKQASTMNHPTAQKVAKQIKGLGFNCKKSKVINVDDVHELNNKKSDDKPVLEKKSAEILKDGLKKVFKIVVDSSDYDSLFGYEIDLTSFLNSKRLKANGLNHCFVRVSFNKKIIVTDLKLSFEPYENIERLHNICSAFDELSKYIEKNI